MVDKGRSRLGRGLNSLISISSGEEPAIDSTASIDQGPPAVSAMPQSITPGPIEISLASITPNPHQPRRQFDDGQLSGLAESLKSSGMIQPIVVKKSKDGYQLIAGERRLRSCKDCWFCKNTGDFPRSRRECSSPACPCREYPARGFEPLDRAAAYQSLIDQQRPNPGRTRRKAWRRAQWHRQLPSPSLTDNLRPTASSRRQDHLWSCQTPRRNRRSTRAGAIG